MLVRLLLASVVLLLWWLLLVHVASCPATPLRWWAPHAVIEGPPATTPTTTIGCRPHCVVTPHRHDWRRLLLDNIAAPSSSRWCAAIHNHLRLLLHNHLLWLLLVVHNLGRRSTWCRKVVGEHALPRLLLLLRRAASSRGTVPWRTTPSATTTITTWPSI